jgi:hypothetical protein
MKKNLLFYLSALLILSSCETEHLYGPDGILENDICDTVDLTYTNQIKPLFDGNCMDCHSTDNASGNIILDNYASIKDAINTGKVTTSINYEASGSKFNMPPSRKMNDCKILQISKWIEEGMKE